MDVVVVVGVIEVSNDFVVDDQNLLLPISEGKVSLMVG